MSLAAIDNLNLTSLLDTMVSLGAAFVLGGAIGFERQVRQRTAGLRTNTLVAIGAASFVDMANRLGGHSGSIQVAAYVVSGIGFLGAGAIMKEGANISGLNTAATLWGSGAVGACAGADLIGEATLAAMFVLASNTLLRPIVNRINRQPRNEQISEATYTVYVVTKREFQAPVRERLMELLEAAQYPVHDIRQHAFGATDMEIEATLDATSIESDQLDELMKQLAQEPGVVQAFWNPSSED